MNRNELLTTLREAYPIAEKRDSEYRTYQSKIRSVRGRRITLNEVSDFLLPCLPREQEHCLVKHRLLFSETLFLLLVPVLPWLLLSFFSWQSRFI